MYIHKVPIYFFVMNGYAKRNSFLGNLSLKQTLLVEEKFVLEVNSQKRVFSYFPQALYKCSNTE